MMIRYCLCCCHWYVVVVVVVAVAVAVASVAGQRKSVRRVCLQPPPTSQS